MALGRVALEKGLGHEGEVLMNRISAHIRETPESSLAPSAIRGYEKITVCNLEEGIPRPNHAGPFFTLHRIQREHFPLCDG